MIIYTAKTDKVPTKSAIIDSSLWGKAFNNNYTLMSSGIGFDKQRQVVSDMHYTYYGLVSFNNKLDSDSKESFEYLNTFLNDYRMIKDSLDNRCKSYYEKMTYWYNKYSEDKSDKTVNEIKIDIQNLMKYLERLGIVKESGCNLKKNYY